MFRWVREQAGRRHPGPVMLLVGMRSDRAVRLVKGRAPFRSEAERLESLRLCPEVDGVILFCGDAERLMADVRPDFLVAGAGEPLPLAGAEHAGAVLLCPTVLRVSPAVACLDHFDGVGVN